MLKKTKFVIFAVISILIGSVIYSNNSIYLVEPFFSITPHPKSPIDDICGKVYDPIRTTLAYAEIALDAKERIYIMGSKKRKIQILVLNQQGRIERIITPYLKNGRFLKWACLFSVSPSGNHIWIAGWEKSGVIRVTLHDLSGRSKKDWLIRGYYDYEPSLINAYSEHKSYFRGSVEDCFYIEKDQKEAQKFKIPSYFPPIIFYNGRYWGIVIRDRLIKRADELKFQKPITHEARKSLYGVVTTWSPQEGVKLISTFKLPRHLDFQRYHTQIQWIDKDSNFYIYRYRTIYLDELLPSWAKGWIVDKIINALGLLNYRIKLPKTIVVLSPKGKVLEVIPLPFLHCPTEKEKFEYGQLVKVDAKGIYIEIVRVSKAKIYEVKEYHIARIVKKRRWQVWWERLMGRSER